MDIEKPLYFHEYCIKTLKHEIFKDITPLINKALKDSRISNGIIIAYSPHTTAGITINENTDSNVNKDIISSLDKVFPIVDIYKHDEGNSHAHIKTSLVGSSATAIINNGQLMLGKWQAFYFCEFDGPKMRKIYIKIIQG